MILLEILPQSPAGIEAILRSKLDKYLRFHKLGYISIKEAYDSATDTKTVTIRFTHNSRHNHIIRDIIGRILLASSKNANKYISYDKYTNTLTVRIPNYVLRNTIYETVAKAATVHEFSKLSDGYKIICSPNGRVDLLSDDLEALRAINIPGVSSVTDVWQHIISNKSKLIIHIADASTTRK